MPVCSQCQHEQPEGFSGERCPRCNARWNARPRQLSGFSLPAMGRAPVSPRVTPTAIGTPPPTGEFRLDDGIDRWDSSTPQDTPRESPPRPGPPASPPPLPRSDASHAPEAAPEPADVLEYGKGLGDTLDAQRKIAPLRPFSERPKSFGRPATGSYPTAAAIGVRSTQNMGLDETRGALEALERQKAEAAKREKAQAEEHAEARRTDTAPAPRGAPLVPPRSSRPAPRTVPPPLPLPSDPSRTPGSTTRAFGPATRPPSGAPPAHGVVSSPSEAPPRTTLVGITNEADEPSPYDLLESGLPRHSPSPIGTTASIFINDEIREAADHLPHSLGIGSSGTLPAQRSDHEPGILQTLQAIPALASIETPPAEAPQREARAALALPEITPSSERPPLPAVSSAATLPSARPVNTPSNRPPPVSTSPPGATTRPPPRAPEVTARLPTYGEIVKGVSAAAETAPLRPSSRAVAFPSTERRMRGAMIAAGGGLLLASAVGFTGFDARLVLWVVPGLVTLLMGAVHTDHSLRERVAVLIGLPVLAFELLGVTEFTRFGAMVTALLLATLPPALLVRRDVVALARTRDVVAFALILAGAWVLTPGAGGVISGTFVAQTGSVHDLVTGSLLPWILLSLLGLKSRATTAGCGLWASGIVLWAAALPVWRLFDGAGPRTTAAVRYALGHALATGSLAALVMVAVGSILVAQLKAGYEARR